MLLLLLLQWVTVGSRSCPDVWPVPVVAMEMKPVQALLDSVRSGVAEVRRPMDSGVVQAQCCSAGYQGTTRGSTVSTAPHRSYAPPPHHHNYTPPPHLHTTTTHHLYNYTPPPSQLHTIDVQNTHRCSFTPTAISLNTFFLRPDRLLL